MTPFIQCEAGLCKGAILAQRSTLSSCQAGIDWFLMFNSRPTAKVIEIWVIKSRVSSLTGMRKTGLYACSCSYACWDTMGVVLSGTGTQIAWPAMGLGHNGPGSPTDKHRVRDTMGLGHSGPGTQLTRTQWAKLTWNANQCLAESPYVQVTQHKMIHT